MNFRQMQPMCHLKKITLIVLLISGHTLLRGQTTAGHPDAADTLRTLKTFLTVCNAYKQLPLQLEVTLRRSTNIVTGQEDTMNVHVRFCLQKEGSYVGFGELEQLADDSLLLLVSNKLKRMILYANHQSPADQLKKYLGIQLKDSSLLQLAAKFTAHLDAADKDTTIIDVNSKALLFHTSLPKEAIRIKYHTADLQPFEVVQITRNLVPVDKSVYAGLIGKAEFEGRLLSVSDSLFFIIRDQIATFSYTTISHRTDIPLPARLSDRIVADVPGKYRPVKGYEPFLVTQNF